MYTNDHNHVILGFICNSCFSLFRSLVNLLKVKLFKSKSVRYILKYEPRDHLDSIDCMKVKYLDVQGQGNG